MRVPIASCLRTRVFIGACARVGIGYECACRVVSVRVCGHVRLRIYYFFCARKIFSCLRTRVCVRVLSTCVHMRVRVAVCLCVCL
jgi:hypothetical protein